MTSFTSTILEWFRDNGRTLPWRETHDPYAIWLSEIILQQTRIEQGRPYWERFMHRWPTVEDLAAASEDEVLREWQGLGYYSRARNLHAAAKQVVARGGFPTTTVGLRQLKGVGDYTAAAIGSFAFGLPSAVVDGNVYRVLSRHYGIDTPINTTEGKKVFAALAQELMDALTTHPSPLAADYNQGLMDFGATHCTPTSPLCRQCPLQETCVALREGRVAELPVKKKTLQVKERHLTYIYIRCNGYTAIHRRPAGDIWQGLYEPLFIETSHLSPLTPHLSPLKNGVKHLLTHRVLYADFWLWETDVRPPLPDDYFWIKEEDIGNYAVPRLIEILLESLPAHSPMKPIHPMNMINIAIFVSGGGTNCENLIKYFKNSTSVNCALVVSNKADAYALVRAERLGVPTAVTPKAQLNDAQVMLPLMQQYGIDFIVLAGFLPLIPDYLIEAFPHRIVNLHPALLPKFGGKGMWGHHVHEAVKAAGETETGMTVHYVSPVCDGGDIIAQFSTPLSPDDTVDDIAEKEHLLEMAHFPQVVEQVLKETFSR